MTAAVLAGRELRSENATEHRRGGGPPERFADVLDLKHRGHRLASRSKALRATIRPSAAENCSNVSRLGANGADADAVGRGRRRDCPSVSSNETKARASKRTPMAIRDRHLEAGAHRERQLGLVVQPRRIWADAAAHSHAEVRNHAFSIGIAPAVPPTCRYCTSRSIGTVPSTWLLCWVYSTS